MAKIETKKATFKKCKPERALAATEVLAAVWLSENNFELEYNIDASDVTEDVAGNPWVTVRIQVPQLDVELWLDDTHPDQPHNKNEDD